MTLTRFYGQGHILASFFQMQYILNHLLRVSIFGTYTQIHHILYEKEEN